jgi:hypothetical protein
VFKVSFRQVTWSGLSIKERVIWEIRLSKSKCTQRIRQYGKIVSLVSIYYYYCLNRRSVIFLYWRLSILFYLILYSFPTLRLSQSQRKICFLYIHQFGTIELFLEQFNCSWDKLFLEQLMDNFGTISVHPKSAPPSQRPSPG